MTVDGQSLVIENCGAPQGHFWKELDVVKMEEEIDLEDDIPDESVRLNQRSLEADGAENNTTKGDILG